MDFEYKDEEFSKMKFNIVGEFADKEVIFLYPQLRGYEVFDRELPVEVKYSEESEVDFLNRDKVIRFSMFYVDPKSPFITLPDIEARKLLAAKKAKLDPAEKAVRHLMDGYVNEANEIISALFKEYNNRLYEIWFSGVEAFSEIIGKVRSRVNEDSLADDKLLAAYKIKRVNFTDALAMHKDLEEIENNLFSGNDNLRKIVEETSTAVIKGNKLERMAHKKKEQSLSGLHS